jgi:2-furoyl-CoA dehydrogenase large subunit
MDSQPLVGSRIRRKEDAALLTGKGRYTDDLPVLAGTLFAHVVRSPHAHAIIRGISCAAAVAADGVRAVITGEDIRRMSDPFLVAVKELIGQWSLAVERVRYVGEPVAVVVATSRYLAEDAAVLVDVDYEPQPAVIEPLKAAAARSPRVHESAGSNVISAREFRYGEPDRAFAEADAVVSLTSTYPRNSFTPMECFVVVAEYRPADGVYDVLSNFQGPFSVHPVMARALRVPGNRLRLRTAPDSGGSFGIRQSVFPFIVLMGLASASSAAR